MTIHDHLMLSDEEPQVVIWKSLWNPRWPDAGLEHAIVRALSASGVIVGVDENDRSFRLDYVLQWDRLWHTRAIEVEVTRGATKERIELESDGEGSWSDRAGRERAELAGCLDVDLWPSPITNTLPIRRLRLEAGERSEIDVAWIDALEARVSRVRQAYSPSADGSSVRFESVGTAFAVELVVDELGLVREYPGLFRRVFPENRAKVQADQKHSPELHRG